MEPAFVKVTEAVDVGANPDTLVPAPTGAQDARGGDTPLPSPYMTKTSADQSSLQAVMSALVDAETSVIVVPAGNVVLPARKPMLAGVVGVQW